MEEPEFWARAGYSESFKKEWKKYYGFDWRPQHESPENTYLSSKLKYYLYYRALNEVFTFAKEYGKSKGMDVKCYVPHPLVGELFAMADCQSGSKSCFTSLCRRLHRSGMDRNFARAEFLLTVANVSVCSRLPIWSMVPWSR